MADQKLSIFKLPNGCGSPLFSIACDDAKAALFQCATKAAQKALDSMGGALPIKVRQGNLSQKAHNFPSALIEAIRRAGDGSNVHRHAFDLVEVTNGLMIGLQAIGIGSNKERRERACSVALAIAATKDPRFAGEITGSLKVVADGCQIVEMNDKETTTALDGNPCDAAHWTPVPALNVKVTELVPESGSASVPLVSASLIDDKVNTCTSSSGADDNIISSFRIGGNWKWERTPNDFCGLPVYFCRRDLEANKPKIFKLNQPGMPYVGQGHLFMYSEHGNSFGPWLVIQARDWNPKDLQPFWKCNSDPRNFGAHQWHNKNKHGVWERLGKYTTQDVAYDSTSNQYSRSGSERTTTVDGNDRDAAHCSHANETRFHNRSSGSSDVTSRSRSPRFCRYQFAMDEEVNKYKSSSGLDDASRHGIGQDSLRWLKRPFSLTECWHAWLLCQPEKSMHRRRWPDPASWAFWHIDRLERSRRESDDQVSYDVEESALKECSPMGYYRRLTKLGDNWRISVSPFDILFSQGSISSVFGGGRHRQHLVDSTIKEILSGEVDYTVIPEIDVFEFDGRLRALTGNRRLFVMRVLASIGVVETMTVVLRDQRDPELHRLRHDPYRLHSVAPKWERHLSSDTNGLVVRINSPGSSFQACQALPPCKSWTERV